MFFVNTKKVSFESEFAMKKRHFSFYFDNFIEIFYTIELSIILNINKSNI